MLRMAGFWQQQTPLETYINLTLKKMKDPIKRGA